MRRGEASWSSPTLAALIEQSNEQWVEATRRIPPSLLPNLLALTGPRVDEAFALLDLAAPGVAVAWTGSGPSPNWLDLGREYTERWVHHAQMRRAVGVPPLLERRWLRPVLDVFMCCLPRAYEDVSAEEGTRIGVEIEGDAGGQWQVQRGAERWHLVRPSGQTADARVTMSAEVAWQLLSRTGTVDDVLGSIRLAGNPELGWAATRAVAVMTTRI